MTISKVAAFSLLGAADASGGNGDAHIFERGGLGKAPFAVVGYEKVENKCDFCGTPILHNFIIHSADGKRFVVGSDCVEKTGDAGLISSAKAIEKENRQSAKGAAEKDEIRALSREHKTRMEALRHPFASKKAFRGLSLMDYADFVLKNAGEDGARKAIKTIKEALGLP